MAPAPLSTLLAFCSAIANGSSTADWLPPPVCSHTLITDTLASPALFLLIEFLKSANNSNGQRPTSIIWLAADASGQSHLSAVARRAGVNLTQLTAKGRFTLIDAAQVILDGDSDEAALRSLYTRVQGALPAQNADPELGASSQRPRCIVIIDDVSSLLWSVASQGDPAVRSIHRWIVALRSLCTRHQSSLVTLQHLASTSPSADAASTTLFHRLLRCSHIWIEVKELSSGRARDCSGEISVHPLVDVTSVQLVSPAAGGWGKGVLYNVANDGSVVIWAKGTQGTS